MSDTLRRKLVEVSERKIHKVSDAAAGFGDSASFGLTRKIRQALGVDNVNYCSAAYGGGGLGGTAIQLAIPVERLIGVGVQLAAEARATKAVTDTRLGKALADDFRGGPNPIGDGSALDAARTPSRPVTSSAKARILRRPSRCGIATHES